MNKEKILPLLLVISILNIVVGAASLIFTHREGLNITGLSSITIGISCLVIYYVKRKKGADSN